MKHRASLLAAMLLLYVGVIAQQTQKPQLYGKHWMAITGKPLAATAGAMTFEAGGNAVDAACAMLAATCTMWDVLSWGGETQALIYNPKTGKVLAINGMGVAPAAATVAFFKNKGFAFPPEYGPLAATTPGTPGALMFMLARYGKLSLAQVLKPAIEMAAGYPMEAQTANSIERHKDRIKQWPYSAKTLLTHKGMEREAPLAGEIFVQDDLHETLLKLVEAENLAIAAGMNRYDAIMAAYDRFYKGDIALEFVRGSKEQGGVITMDDLAGWQPLEEEPVSITYRDMEIYKLSFWTQGPAMLQALNILENFNLPAMRYNSAVYIHTVTQAMQLAFADRDFYYGDPGFAPAEPAEGLLSKAYAASRAKLINPQANDPHTSPGNPYAFQGSMATANQTHTGNSSATHGYAGNPYAYLLNQRLAWLDENSKVKGKIKARTVVPQHDIRTTGDEKVSDTSSLNIYFDRLYRGTTTIEAADAEGWVVSVTPSGGWIPACIAGNTGIGMSQRMQSFVLDSIVNPYNLQEPGKRPRVTLSPTMVLRDGRPFLSFAVQGGDTQDQNQLQFFLNVTEFGMDVQQATEAANFNTNQLWLSLGGTAVSDRVPRPGELLIRDDLSTEVQQQLQKMGYVLLKDDRTSGPLNAIFIDNKNKVLVGGSSNYGEDYGIGW